MSPAPTPLDVRLLASAVRTLARREPRFTRFIARHGPKSAYLSGLATQLPLGWLERGALESLPDTEVADALDALPAVRPWTVQ